MKQESVYIRDEIPSLTIPPFDGDTVETLAPDTLDLAVMAKLAINGLTGPTDPELDYEVYWQVNFFRDPPIMLHDHGDNVVAKFMEALPLQRVITGSDLNHDPAAELAGKLVTYIKDHRGFFDGEARFIDEAWESIHFHAHTADLLSMLEYATAVGDRDLMEFVRKGYEFGRTKGSSAVGFFPELIEDAPRPDHHPRSPRGCLCSETCEVADMIALALKLSVAGVGDYWDDADRWVRNQFAENQLTRTDWVERIPKPNRITPVASNETSDRVAERNLGAFAGWPSANDWTIFAGIQHCCTANGARAIYYAWEHALSFEEGVLTVNLLLNRASIWADVDSHIPYTGRVDLKIKQRCADVLVRVPEWVETGIADVSCTVDGLNRTVQWRGRYVGVGEARPGDSVSLYFPICENTTSEVIGCVLYTLVTRGSTVVFIDPPGKHHPLYQRAHYRENETRWRKAARFVPHALLKW